MSTEAAHAWGGSGRKRTEPQEARGEAAEQVPAKLPAGAAGDGAAEGSAAGPGRRGVQLICPPTGRRVPERDVLEGEDVGTEGWQPDGATLQDPTGLLWFLAHGLGKIASASSARVCEDGFVEVALDEMMVAVRGRQRPAARCLAAHAQRAARLGSAPCIDFCARC